jgi:hypothetical protein
MDAKEWKDKKSFKKKSILDILEGYLDRLNLKRDELAATNLVEHDIKITSEKKNQREAI